MNQPISPEILFYESAATLHRQILDGTHPCVDVLDHFIGRIQVMNPKINAFLYIDEEDAFAYAKQVDRMVREGFKDKSLLGIPIAVPDSVDMLRAPTTYGSLLLEKHIPTFEVTEVTLIKNAGAIIVGKTNISEFGLAPDTVNLLRKPCLNPWNLEYSVGGPNGGAGAAVVAGLAPFALAQDFCGGLRMTASFCQLVGLLPSRGRVPHIRGHYLPFSERFFFRKGVIAREIRDAAMLLDVLSHRDCRDPISCDLPHEHFLESIRQTPRRCKIAVSQDLGFVPFSQDVQEATMEAARRLAAMGHEVTEVRFHLNENILFHFANIMAADRYLMIANLLGNDPEKGQKIMDSTKEWLRYGDQVTGVQYSLAETFSQWLTHKVDNLFREYDLLLTPVCPVAPFKVGRPPHEVSGKPLHPLLGLWSYTCPFNMSGHPVIVLPCKLSREGLPIGFQLAGPLFSEKELVQLGAEYERAHPWKFLFN